MKTKTTLPISLARKNIFSIAEEVQNPNVYYTLTERGIPKAVLLSAKQFEEILEKKEQVSCSDGMVLRDGALTGYQVKDIRQIDKLLIVRERSGRGYLEKHFLDEDRKARDLIKAQLYVELIEKYGYPLNLIELGKYVRVGGRSSKKYIEADIIVHNKEKNARLLFAVSSPREYEEDKEETIEELFDLAKSLYVGIGEFYLLYYTRENGKERVMTIDYPKIRSLYAWKKLGKPFIKAIPME